MKKILLNESEKKAIISQREKAIIESFSKTFNSIKRVDENYGEDYELASRGVEYGINPEIEPDYEMGNTYKVEVIGKEAEKDGGYKHRWVYEINANSDEEAEALAADKFNEGMKYSDIYLFSVKAIQNPTEDDIVKPMGDKIGEY
jgi:hypothetical protein